MSQGRNLVKKYHKKWIILAKKDINLKGFILFIIQILTLLECKHKYYTTYMYWLVFTHFCLILLAFAFHMWKGYFKNSQGPLLLPCERKYKKKKEQKSDDDHICKVLKSHMCRSRIGYSPWITMCHRNEYFLREGGGKNMSMPDIKSIQILEKQCGQKIDYLVLHI